MGESQAERPARTLRSLSLFFFSSRRRHTRFDCDWSSDVCSSDLVPVTFGLPGGQPGATGTVPNSLHGAISAYEHPNAAGALARAPNPPGNATIEIGRASCRERV